MELPSQAHVRRHSETRGEALEGGRSFSQSWVEGFSHSVWLAARGGLKNAKPSIHELMLAVDTNNLTALEKGMQRESRSFLRATLVDQDGLPWRQDWASRKQLQRGLFLVPSAKENGENEMARMPFDREAVCTLAPRPASIKFTELQLLLQHNVQTWWGCFTAAAQEELRKIMEDIRRDEREAAKGGSAHRLRRDPRKAATHVAVSLEGY